jgi:hypothetical protein
MTSRLTFDALLLTREVKYDRLTVTHLARPAVLQFICCSKGSEGQGSRGPNVLGEDFGMNGNNQQYPDEHPDSPPATPEYPFRRPDERPDQSPIEQPPIEPDRYPDRPPEEEPSIAPEPRHNQG